jgi:hypothetical protein
MFSRNYDLLAKAPAVSQAGMASIPIGPGVGVGILVLGLIGVAYELGRRRGSRTNG